MFDASSSSALRKVAPREYSNCRDQFLDLKGRGFSTWVLIKVSTPSCSVVFKFPRPNTLVWNFEISFFQSRIYFMKSNGFETPTTLKRYNDTSAENYLLSSPEQPFSQRWLDQCHLIWNWSHFTSRAVNLHKLVQQSIQLVFHQRPDILRAHLDIWTQSWWTSLKITRNFSRRLWRAADARRAIYMSSSECRVDLLYLIPNYLAIKTEGEQRKPV